MGGGKSAGWGASPTPVCSKQVCCRRRTAGWLRSACACSLAAPVLSLPMLLLMQACQGEASTPLSPWEAWAAWAAAASQVQGGALHRAGCRRGGACLWSGSRRAGAACSAHSREDTEAGRVRLPHVSTRTFRMPRTSAAALPPPPVTSHPLVPRPGMNGHGGHGHHHQRRSKKDAAHEMQLQCSLEDLFKGTTRRMKIRWGRGCWRRLSYLAPACSPAPRPNLSCLSCHVTCVAVPLPLTCARSRKRLDASGMQHPETEILEINVRPGWKAGTKITFQEKGAWAPQEGGGCGAGGAPAAARSPAR